MKVIIIDNGDGTVAIDRPYAGFVLENLTGPPLTDDDGDFIEDGTGQVIHEDIPLDDVLAAHAARVVPAGKSFRIADDSDIPTDRAFRNAWTDDLPGKQVDVDMGRARDIHMDVIREYRDIKLKELDIETMKGNDVQAEKQILRNLPGNFDLTAAATPAELKSLWPDELA